MGKPQYGKGKIDWAGAIITDDSRLSGNPVSREAVVEYFEAMDVVNHWRAVHSYPLHAIKMTLKRRAQAIDANAIIAQRLKRSASIRLKLKLSTAGGNHPNLSQMQDIGGCRAVMGSVAQVRRLEKVFAEAARKSPHRGPQFHKATDYISQPKSSGYRGIHLIYKFRTDSPKHSCYNGQRIEIQIRSRLQHYWATAVETYSTFTGEALKSNLGSDLWKRFFALVSTCIALQESSPIIPGTPGTIEDLEPEMKRLYRELNVDNVLSGWSIANKAIEDTDRAGAKDAAFYLLVLNPNVFDLDITVFRVNELALANSEYSRIEKDRPDLQAVLVSVDSLASLRTAYPNYFLDTVGFLGFVKKLVKEPRSTAASNIVSSILTSVDVDEAVTRTHLTTSRK